MAVTVDTSRWGGSPAPGTSLTFSVTVGANSNRAILVGTNGQFGGGFLSVTGVTYAGGALSSAGSVSGSIIWARVAPNTGANNVVISYSTYGNAWNSTLSAYDVDQSTPTGTAVSATGTSNTPSTGSITVPANGMAFGFTRNDYISSGAPSAGGGVTSIGSTREGGGGTAAASGYRTTTGAISYTIPGSAAWTALGVPINPTSGGASHPSTGALSAQAATVAGTAVHLTLHTSSGTLAAQAATVAGTAAHQHKATGALAAQAAAVAGSASHLTLHTSSGALAAQAATVAGSADHAAPGVHDAAGALAAQAATVAGAATHLTLHTSTGALVAQAATVAGAAVHNSARTSSGTLVAQAATVSGQAQIGAGTPFDHDWWLKQWKKKKPESTTTYQSPEELQTEVAPVVRQAVKQAARSRAPEWNPARLDSLTAQLNVTQKLVAAIKQQLDEEDDETVLLLL